MSQFLPISSSILSSIIDKLPSPKMAQPLKIKSLLDSIPDSKLIDESLKDDLIECNKDGLICGYISKMLSIPNEELPENQPTILSKDDLFERGRIARIKAAKAAEMASKIDKVLGTVEDGEAETSPTKNDEFEFEFDYEEEESEEENDEDSENKEVYVSTETLVAFTRVYSGTIRVNDTISILSPLFDSSKPADDEDNAKHHHEIKVERLYILMGRDLTSVQSAPAGTLIGLVSSSFLNIVLKSGTIIDTNIVKANRSINFARSKSIIDVPPIVRVTLEPVKLKSMDKLLQGIKQLNLADPCVRGYMNDDGEVVLETAGELHLERCVRDLEERFAKIDITVGKPIVPFRETVLKRSEDCIKIGKFNVTISVEPHDREKEDDGVTLLDSVKYNDILIKDKSITENSLDGSIRSGYLLAIKEGPILNEPLEGVKIRIESIIVDEDDESSDDNQLSKIRESIRSLVLKSSPHIKLAMYVVDIQTSAELLGKVYTVIQKQRGSILTEEMKEGTPFFTVEAKLPVLTSFGFSEEIRKKTSGGAIPQLVFSGFETWDEDPFWVPTTEEEIEELGETGDRENWIRAVMNDIRKSKGLFVDEKVVKDAEKQRTLKKD